MEEFELHKNLISTCNLSDHNRAIDNGDCPVHIGLIVVIITMKIAQN